MFSAYQNREFDIIIQAGQSNAEGCGRGDVQNEYVVSDRIFYLNSGCDVAVNPDGLAICYPHSPFITIAAERQDEGGKIGDFSLAFAREYKKTFLPTSRDILIIRAAVGGTGFKKEQWGEGKILDLKLHEMIALALSLNQNNRLIAFLWHQGEHDAAENHIGSKIKDVHYNNLLTLVSAVRQRYDSPNLPFIAGSFVEEWRAKNADSCAPVLSAIQQICEDVGNGAFIETSDLLSNNQAINNGDDIHFSRQALYTLGERYFKAYQAIAKQSVL